jgi:hypothetical protein
LILVLPAWTTRTTTSSWLGALIILHSQRGPLYYLPSTDSEPDDAPFELVYRKIVSTVWGVGGSSQPARTETNMIISLGSCASPTSGEALPRILLVISPFREPRIHWALRRLGFEIIPGLISYPCSEVTSAPKGLNFQTFRELALALASVLPLSPEARANGTGTTFNLPTNPGRAQRLDKRVSAD